MLDQKPSDGVIQKREPIFNVSFIVLGFIMLCASIHLVRIYILTPEQNFIFIYYTAFIPARFGQPVFSTSTFSIFTWTSTISYSLIHGNFSHMLSNCLWLGVFGSPLANTIGTSRFVLFWIVCAFVAALFHFVGQPLDTAPMIGASGAVAGAMGAAARFGFAVSADQSASRFEPNFAPVAIVFQNKSVVTFLGIFLLSNLMIAYGLFGETFGNIAWQAHIGGIIAGFVLIPWFIPKKRPS